MTEDEKWKTEIEALSDVLAAASERLAHLENALIDLMAINDGAKIAELNGKIRDLSRSITRLSRYI